MLWKNACAAALSIALFFSSPGLPAYRAFAQTIAQPAAQPTPSPVLITPGNLFQDRSPASLSANPSQTLRLPASELPSEQAGQKPQRFSTTLRTNFFSKKQADIAGSTQETQAKKNAHVSLAQTVVRNDPEHETRLRERVGAFLQQYPMLRVYVPSAPGNGHQSAASVTLQRLRELGFTGRFEVVYENAAKSKMDIVLPGFEPSGPNIQKIADAVAMPMSDIQQKTQRIPLGIISAADKQRAPSYINVDHLLTLQPFLWGEASLHAPDGSAIKASTKRLKPMPWVYELPDPEKPAEFIAQETARSARFAEKTAGLQSLAGALESKNFLPVYDNPAKNGISKILALLLGLRKAQEQKPQSFKQGGVLLPVFWDLNDICVRNLQDRISRERSLNGKVQVMSITDPDFAKSMASLRQGEALVIGVGNVPRKIFEFFYEKADLPPLAAGVNAQNLLYLLGKPFFHTLYDTAFSLFDEHRFKRILERADAKTQLLFTHAQHALSNLTWEDDEKVIHGSSGSIAEFILASLEPDSELRHIFEKSKVPDQRLDKVLLALDAARRALDAPTLNIPATPDEQDSVLVLKDFQPDVPRFSVRRALHHAFMSWRNENALRYPLTVSEHLVLAALSYGLLFSLANIFMFLNPPFALSGGIDMFVLLTFDFFVTLLSGSILASDHIKEALDAYRVALKARRYKELEYPKWDQKLLGMALGFEKETGWKIVWTDSDYLLAKADPEYKRVLMSVGWILRGNDPMDARREPYLHVTLKILKTAINDQ
jgi:hypothetical protein